nr:hypothetical protein Y57G11C.27 - Caenorhabditis elegans [Caenorhabditis elegans]
MNRLLEYGNVEAIPYCNCSHNNFTEWEKTGQKRPYFGWPLVVFGVLVELLYIPVIYIIFKTKLIRNPCYKIILLLALIDMSATCCSCLITGPMLIVGAVFCMYPTFTYVAGGFVLNTWCMACATTISLFLNRVISIGCRKYADEIEKKIAYISKFLVVSYGSFVFWFTPSLIFNSVFMCWIADPLSETVPISHLNNLLTKKLQYETEHTFFQYKNTVQAWNNWIFVTCMFTLLTIYFVLVKRLEEGQKSKA